MTTADILARLRDRHSQTLRLHFIGVAGSGMSGLADLALALGHWVSGSDRVSSRETDRLLKRGLVFSTPHSGEVIEGVDAVVYSSAVREGNPAYDAAVAAGLPMLRRAETLAAVASSRRLCLVSGTHGKTTTSALLAHVLREAGLHPSHYVGAEVSLLGSNAFWDPDGEVLVAEGDESDGSLVCFEPHDLIVLNVEEDHIDHFAGLSEIEELFAEVASRATGCVIYCAEDRGACSVCAGLSSSVSYGWSTECDYAAAVLAADGQSTEFTVLHRGEKLGRVELGIPGEHNVLNALAVIAAACEERAEFPAIQRAFKTFRGARRRFDRKYLGRNFTVIDDYGHHPSEVRATIATARSLNPTRLVVLFQPHRYSRTQRFASEFGEALARADRVFVADIYPASEEPIEGVSGAMIAEAVRRESEECSADFLPEKSETHWHVGRELRSGDLLLTLGAGDIHVVGSRLAADLETLEALEETMDDSGAVVRLYKYADDENDGPVRIWVEPRTVNGYARARQFADANNLPLEVVSSDSGIDVRGGGFDGVVVCFGGAGRPSESVEKDLLVLGEEKSALNQFVS